MNLSRSTLVGICLATFVLNAQGVEQPRADPDLPTQALRILRERCAGCHGDDPKKLRGGLDLRSRAAALRGGDSGRAALTPGFPERSPLFVAVTRADPDTAMPPKESERLSPTEIERLRRWILAGAAWPQPTRPANAWVADVAGGVTVATSGGRSPEWTQRRYQPEDLWAYRPVIRPVVPDLVPHPIDAFLQASQRKKGIAPTPTRADRVTLLRRATIDLTGLPPTPEEFAAFLSDDRPEAWGNVLSRLLHSPHHGEQMARHWLDVVRYADTAGFANDYERPNAWRYRDYVVRAFAEDRPYDRFIVEQLAGDELDPHDPEMLVAVGFLRMGPWEHTGMSVAALTRQMFLDDVTHSVGVTFLAQGLRCASCHDHKFDPIPTKDYYRLQAVFAPTQFAERPAPFSRHENTGGFDESRRLVQNRLADATTARERLVRKSENAIAAYLKSRGVARLADLPEGERPAKARYGLSKLEQSLIRIELKRGEYFARELLRYEPFAFSVYDGPPVTYLSNKAINGLPAKRTGPVQAVHVLTGGALDTPGEKVTPGVLSAVAGSHDGVAPSAWNTIPKTAEGRRLALARWIASPTHPLTARVLVNRVWQWHFGRGLVATSNNFGKMGKRPSHPELLDFLATWFVEHGWSIRSLHRLIMTSDNYRQASVHPDQEKLQRLDPANELLAVFPSRRMAAEEIRDSMLAISGELNRERGGPGVFPEINWEAALQPRHIMGSVAPAYQPSPRPEQRNRRTLYAFRYRTLADPFHEVFNRPNSEMSCERREETTVTPQAFALFNSVFAHARALAFADRLAKRSADPEERVKLAIRTCYGREPTPVELADCREHLAKMTAHHRAHPPVPDELPTRVRRRMIEEMTGEEYEWEEVLDGMATYRRDLQPWQVDATTRALADVCLVLFNSNEFLYVR